MALFGDILGATIIFAVPLMLVALGGMFSERSGVINIALEGIMIIGALFGCLALSKLNTMGFGAEHPYLGMIIAILVAAATRSNIFIIISICSNKFKSRSNNRRNCIKYSCTSICGYTILGNTRARKHNNKFTNMDKNNRKLIGNKYFTRILA